MNEIFPIGFIPPVKSKEVREAAPTIDKEVAALPGLTRNQRDRVKVIALAYVENNYGRLPNFTGLARLVRSQDAPR